MSREGPEDRQYALELDEREVARYRMMADQARAAEADLWELAGIGPGARVADADGTAFRTRPEHADLTDLNERYAAFRAARGDDNQAGLRLADRLVRAGLELVEFRGRCFIGQPPAGVRPPAWAAREAMVAAGTATPDDVRRWDRALQEVAAAPVPPTIFAPFFTAVGRRPA
jgi:hypothetical protein